MNIQVKTKPRVPSIQELTYKIYDFHKDMVHYMDNKRMVARTPATIRQIKDACLSWGFDKARFDGMTYHTALEHFKHQAYMTGIGGSNDTPFILASDITLRLPEFNNEISMRWQMIEGMRYCTLQLLPEFTTLASKRVPISNISFALDQIYQCNLHLSPSDVEGIRRYLGEEAFRRLPPNRQQGMRTLFQTACNFYVRPHELPLTDFLRCQVPEFREWNDERIMAEVFMYESENYASLTIDVIKAIDIYYRKRSQWLGVYEDYVLAGTPVEE